MGFFDDLASKVPKGQNKPQFKQKVGGIRLRNIEAKTYSIDFTNWYKSLPYGFRFFPRDGQPSYLSFYLPLNPTNISVRTPMATNIVSTMYGTVEEHSEMRYHDIIISGTTGISPKYTQIFEGDIGKPDQLSSSVTNNISLGRDSYPISDVLSGGVGGFFQRTSELANKAIANAVGTASDALDLVGLGSGRTVESGVRDAVSGFAAFHNFFRFLMEYKRDTAGLDSSQKRKQHPLLFLNYKDGIQYKAAIQDFSWTKDANDPLLYKYTIVMRCYDLRTLDKADSTLGEISDRLSTLGLDGITVSSKFNQLASLSRKAKLTAAAAVATFKGAGG